MTHRFNNNIKTDEDDIKNNEQNISFVTDGCNTIM